MVGWKEYDYLVQHNPNYRVKTKDAKREKKVGGKRENLQTKTESAGSRLPLVSLAE